VDVVCFSARAWTERGADSGKQDCNVDHRLQDALIDNVPLGSGGAQGGPDVQVQIRRRNEGWYTLGCCGDAVTYKQPEEA
jgi:hypothetical protein